MSLAWGTHFAWRAAALLSLAQLLDIKSLDSRLSPLVWVSLLLLPGFLAVMSVRATDSKSSSRAMMRALPIVMLTGAASVDSQRLQAAPRHVLTHVLAKFFARAKSRWLPPVDELEFSERLRSVIRSPKRR